ncbi:MAG: hemin ABC transporter substrate-binding protein [Magnetovibrio sp.]|nr:hemin ABC transporter substrate-binding protein [Magnetovibrio sp.]|tara:strand:+ start:2246 stop:3133 length:888 start_codon:yes stop_codon:yes gene_type:complete
MLYFYEKVSLRGTIHVLTFNLFLLSLSDAFANSANNDPRRVVSIGGSVTEIVYALGQQERLVARDSTSTFPVEAAELPDVGYMRALSAEGVLSVGPELIIAEEGSGPKETIDLLKEASIPFITIPDIYSREGIIAKIVAVGEALGAQTRAKGLIDKLNTELIAAEKKSNSYNGVRKKVLFILSTRGGKILASGLNTAADSIIKMAGGINAISKFNGYKPLSDESITVAAPDVIMMMDRGGNHVIENEKLFAKPAISTTPAAKTNSVIWMNGLYLLGFGPRTASAVSDLHTALYPK